MSGRRGARKRKTPLCRPGMDRISFWRPFGKASMRSFYPSLPGGFLSSLAILYDRTGIDPPFSSDLDHSKRNGSCHRLEQDAIWLLLDADDLQPLILVDK